MKNPTPANPDMADTLLFEHFATLATAPDGIARLRELILQLAVQGKLGTQDAGDEPASVLLEKIKKEKEQLVKEGKIKREKPFESIEEIPFILPKTWVWEKLGNCIPKITDGEHFRPNTVKKGIMFLSAKDIREDHIDFRDPLFVDEGTAIRCRLRCNPEINDILVVSRGAGIGRCCIISTNELFCLLGSVILIKSSQLIDSKYLLFSLKSTIINKQITSLSSNTAQQALYIRDIKDALIPLPPLAEQHRIVAKVDRLMALCDELEARQQKERAGCLQLGTASLAGLQNATHPEEFERQWVQVCDAFDLILDCPENLAVLRQTILHLAVQGRLVRQEPGDEPAGKLVERIRKKKERLVKEGKIKKEKPLEPVLDEEVPFPIPDGWKWVRINDAAKIVEYGTSEKAMSSPSAYGKNSVPVFRMNNIQNGKVIHEDLKYLSNSIEELPHLYLQNNDILINRTNSYELVGKAGIFKGENDKFTFASYLIRISVFPQLVNSDFVNTALNANYFRTSQIEPQVTQQCGQANFSGSKIKNALIPLPPLAEQHRIVAKVDALMALCDQLEARLKERAGMQGRLADAVVKSIGTG